MSKRTVHGYLRAVRQLADFCQRRPNRITEAQVPEELRWVLRGAQRAGYASLFDAGSDRIRALGASSRYLQGCTLGIFGVLHTWGRDSMVYHPHVHFVVPGGGVNHAEQRWQQTPENFLFAHAAAVKVYQGKLADRLKQVDPAIWRKNWIVDIQPVGDGHAVLTYLAPYVHREAISDNRILACDDASLTFQYTPSGQQRSVTRKVAGNADSHHRKQPEPKAKLNREQATTGLLEPSP